MLQNLLFLVHMPEFRHKDLSIFCPEVGKRIVANLISCRQCYQLNVNVTSATMNVSLLRNFEFGLKASVLI